MSKDAKAQKVDPPTRVKKIILNHLCLDFIFKKNIILPIIIDQE